MFYTSTRVFKLVYLLNVSVQKSFLLKQILQRHLNLTLWNNTDFCLNWDWIFINRFSQINVFLSTRIVLLSHIHSLHFHSLDLTAHSLPSHFKPCLKKPYNIEPVKKKQRERRKHWSWKDEKWVIFNFRSSQLAINFGTDCWVYANIHNDFVTDELKAKKKILPQWSQNVGLINV